MIVKINTEYDFTKLKTALGLAKDGPVYGKSEINFILSVLRTLSIENGTIVTRNGRYNLHQLIFSCPKNIKDFEEKLKDAGLDYVIEEE